jgi:hypothetical protein
MSAYEKITKAALAITKPIKRGQGKPTINRNAQKQLDELETKKKKKGKKKK